MVSFIAVALALSAPAADPSSISITVAAGKHDRINVPVRVELLLDKAVAERHPSIVIEGPDKLLLRGQLTAPRLGEDSTAPEGRVHRELHFILPRLEAGRSLALHPRFNGRGPGAPDDLFAWHDEPGKFTELRRTKMPVLRYVYEALDDSSPKQREETFKVFHHVYDPKGEKFVTKGSGGKYTHHRGLFYGFRKCTYGDGIEVDTWHCTDDTYQSHDRFLASEAGPVLGRQRLALSWHGKKKEVFAKEQREVTAWTLPGGTLIEWASRLESPGGKIHLDGDPQHAGFHFRADDEVASRTTLQTVYTRPDGPGEPGKTRNWPDVKTHVNLPFDAMTFVLGDKKYTAVYLDRPENPKDARFSEREYGRFGSYFVHDIDGKHPLLVRYRVWLQEGPMTLEQIQALSADFTEPVRVEVKYSPER
jgi:hypothetical protein